MRKASTALALAFVVSALVGCSEPDLPSPASLESYVTALAYADWDDARESGGQSLDPRAARLSIFGTDEPVKVEWVEAGARRSSGVIGRYEVPLAIGVRDAESTRTITAILTVAQDGVVEADAHD